MKLILLATLSTFFLEVDAFAYPTEAPDGWAPKFNWECSWSVTEPDQIERQLGSKVLESKLNETVKVEFPLNEELSGACSAKMTGTVSYGVPGAIYQAACSFHDRYGYRIDSIGSRWPQSVISLPLTINSRTYTLSCQRISMVSRF